MFLRLMLPNCTEEFASGFDWSLSPDCGTLALTHYCGPLISFYY